MLVVLRIKNFAVVEDIEIEFAQGLNVLTGETGAGKSIILKSLELISGKRASSEIVRNGTEKCEIEALFILSDNSKKQILEIAEDLEDTLSENELLVKRIIDATGRSKIYLNNKLSTATILQNIATPLLDITSQHEQQSLLNLSNHQQMLDTYGVGDDLLDQVREKYLDYNEKRIIYQRFVEKAEEQNRYFQQIQDEHEELSAANLRENEKEELENELKKLANVEQLGSRLSQALSLLEETDGLEDLFRKLEIILKDASKLDPTLEEHKALIDNASIQCSETRLMLANYASTLDADPNRLEEIRERIAEIAKLERKYKRKLSELIEYHQKISSEISKFSSGEFDEKKLKAALDAAKAELAKVEEKLTAERQTAAKKLSKEVESGLSSLKMKNAQFIVKIEKRESTIRGADKIEFLLAANLGEPPRAINKVASGGELSRVLLILKTIINQELSPATQIFDEVDTGIGGAVAEIVGEKLKQISKNSQVILVTHAPQIAAQAESHFLIAKTSDEKNTRTDVSILNPEQRVKQIASMLAGRKVSVAFEDSAKKLLGFS